MFGLVIDGLVMVVSVIVSLREWLSTLALWVLVRFTVQPWVVPVVVVYTLGVVRELSKGNQVSPLPDPVDVLSLKFLYSKLQVYLVFEVGVGSKIVLKLFTVIDVLSGDLNNGDVPPWSGVKFKDTAPKFVPVMFTF